MSPNHLLWVLGLCLAACVNGHTNGNYKEEDYLFNHLRDFPVFAQDVEKTAISQSEETDSKEVQPGPQITVNIIIENSPMMIKNGKDHDKAAEQKKYDHRPHFASKPKSPHGHGHNGKSKQHVNGGGHSIFPMFRFPAEKDAEPSVTAGNGKQEVKVSVVPGKMDIPPPKVTVVQKEKADLPPKSEQQVQVDDPKPTQTVLEVTVPEAKVVPELKLKDVANRPEYQTAIKRLKTDADLARKIVDSIKQEQKMSEAPRANISTGSNGKHYGPSTTGTDGLVDKEKIEPKGKDPKVKEAEPLELKPNTLLKSLSMFEKDLPPVKNQLDDEPDKKEEKEESPVEVVKDAETGNVVPLDKKDVDLPHVDQFLETKAMDKSINLPQSYFPHEILRQKLFKRSINVSESAKEQHSDTAANEFKEAFQVRKDLLNKDVRRYHADAYGKDETALKANEPKNVPQSEVLEKKGELGIAAENIQPPKEETASKEQEAAKKDVAIVHPGRQVNETESEEAMDKDIAKFHASDNRTPKTSVQARAEKPKNETDDVALNKTRKPQELSLAADKSSVDEKDNTTKNETPKAMMVVDKDELTKKQNATEELEKNRLPLPLEQQHKPEQKSHPSLPGVWNRVLPYLAILKRDASVADVVNNVVTSGQKKAVATEPPSSDQMNKISYLQF